MMDELEKGQRQRQRQRQKLRGSSSTTVSSEAAVLRPEMGGVQAAWQLTELGTSETGLNSGVSAQRSG